MGGNVKKIIVSPSFKDLPEKEEPVPVNFVEMAKNARIVLAQKTYGLEFFAVLAYKFLWHFCELDKAIGGYIVLNLRNGVSSDGVIYINTEFINKPGFNQNNLVGIILHELLHQLNKHSIRKGQRDPNLWNIAADHCCDRDAKRINPNFCPRPNKEYNIIDELDQIAPECTAEQAYTWILEKQKESKGNDGNGTPRFKIVFNPDSKVIHVKDSQTGKEWDVNGQISDMSSEEAKELKRKLEQFCAEARGIYQDQRQKGIGGGSASEYLDKVLQPKIPWQTLLEMAIKTNVIMVPDNRSWQKINPYYRHLGITLPGVAMSEDSDGVGRLVVSADTSGSITKKDLMEFSGIIMQSMKYFEVITLITHDDGIHQVVNFTKDNIGEFENWIKNDGYEGRGGTSHIQVFDWIQKEVWDDFDERDTFSMYISLTDGYSDIVENYFKYEWINSETPLVFIITGSWTCEFKNHRNMKIINIEEE